MSTAEKAYRDSATRHLRDELVVNHLELVRNVLGRLAGNLPKSVDRDAMEGAGMVGLLQAAESYDPSKGEFPPYAARRIRGAMLDELRRGSGLPQQMLARIRAIKEARQQLPAPASIEDLAEKTDMTEEEVVDTMDAARWTRVDDGLPLDELVQKPLGRGDLPAGDPAEKLAQQETLEALADSIEKLNERERLVVTMYHLESLRMAEIAEVLKINVGTVSRVLAAAQHKLFEDLRAHIADDEPLC